MSARSLEGRRIVLTRARADAEEWVEALEALGASVLVVPAIERAPVLDAAIWKAAIAQRASFSDLAFTSRAAVDRFLELTREAGLGAGDWSHASVAAVGASTARALDAAGFPALHIGTGGARRLAEELVAAGQIGPTSRVLFPCAREARDELPRILRAGGAEVTELVVYATRPLPLPAPASPLAHELEAGVDGIVFASPSAVDTFFTAAERPPPWLARARAIAIGQTTAARLDERGVEEVILAERPSLEGLIAAIEREFRRGGPAR